MNKVTEKDIETEILNYLDSLGGFVMKINVGGRPLLLPSGKMIMMPFKNIYSRKGISDIFWIHNGLFHAFEVKKHTEHKFIEKHYERLLQGGFSSDNKQHKRWHDQIIFIENIKKNGGKAGFVYSIDCVKSLLG